MNIMFVLLCIVADLLSIAVANPLQRLFFLPVGTNNNYFQSLAVTQSPQSNIERYSLCNTAQNTCPDQPCNQVISNNGLQQFIYRTFLEKSIQKPFLSENNSNNQCCTNNGGLNQESGNTNPSVVNNYIIIPPEVFQADLCEHTAGRKRRRDTGQTSERKRPKKNRDEANRETDVKVDRRRESDGKKDTEEVIPDHREPRKRRRKSKPDPQANDGERNGKRRGGRRKKPKTEFNDTTVLKTNETIKGNNSLSLNETKSHDKFTNIVNSKNETQRQTHLNSTDEVAHNNTSKDKGPSKISSVKSNGTKLIVNSTMSDNTKPEGRAKVKKSKNNIRMKENRVSGKSITKQVNNKEDALIRDFREKFPNIPEQLLKIMIDYMRKQLQNEGSDLSNAYYKYLNYPINFDHFYQSQIANMANNPQITHINNNKKNNKKSTNRNRRRKGKKRNKSDSPTRELTPEIIDKRNENTTAIFHPLIETTKINENETNVQIKIIQAKGSIQKLEPIVVENNNVTTADVKVNDIKIERKNNEFENITETIEKYEPYINETIEDLFLNTNTTQLEQRMSGVKTKDENSQMSQEKERHYDTISFPESKPPINPSLQVKNTTKTAFIINKTVEQPKNERIINIRISVEPHEKSDRKDRPVTNKPQQNLKEELNISKLDTNKTESCENEIGTEESTSSNVNTSSKYKEDTSKQIEEFSGAIECFRNIAEQNKTRENIVMPELGEEDVVPTIEMNEINDYFPNFEADNFAYLLQDDKNELEKLHDGRYHYTTDKSLDTEEANEKTKVNKDPFSFFEKVLPKKSVIDSEKIKTYAEVEDTIQRPAKNKEAEVEFITPPTLETPDFETKPVRIDSNDHFIFYDPEADYTPKRHLSDMDKASVYSDVKSSHYTSNDKSKRDQEKPIFKDIETVFAQSKVVKYGHDADVLSTVNDNETNPVFDQDKNNKNGVAIVYAKSLPW